MEEAAGRINGGKVKRGFTGRHREYAQSLDISKFKHVSKCEISLQGSRIRSLWSRDYWCNEWTWRRGWIADQNGLFARFSDGVTNLLLFLKENKQMTVLILPTHHEINVPAIAALGSAFAATESWSV